MTRVGVEDQTEFVSASVVGSNFPIHVFGVIPTSPSIHAGFGLGVRIGLRICAGDSEGLAAGVSTTALAEVLDVKIVSITSSVRPGEVMTLIIQTQPGAACGGVRQVHSGAFVPMRVEIFRDDGLARWDWRMLPGNCPVGRRDVEVTCTSGDLEGSLKTFFVVE